MLAAFSPEAFSQGHCLSLREGAEAPTYEEVADALGQVADDVYEEPSARQSQVYDDSNAANDSEEDNDQHLKE